METGEEMNGEFGGYMRSGWCVVMHVSGYFV